jgi:hypothetical protein
MYIDLVCFSTNFFHYLVSTTLILDDDTYEPLQFLSYEETSNFYDQTGENTGYITYLEEILAENFVFWMTAMDNLSQLKTPSIVTNMNDIICAGTGIA